MSISDINRRDFVAGGVCAGCMIAAGQAGAAVDLEQVICGFHGFGGLKGVSNVREGAPEAKRIVKMIADSVGIRADIDVLAADFSVGSTAYATIRNRRRRIVYDVAKFTFQGNKTGWREVGILGHEMGHHLASHVHVRSAPNHERELEADFFAGVSIAKFGGTLDHAVEFTLGLSLNGSETHPPRAQRTEAAAQGWLHGQQ